VLVLDAVDKLREGGGTLIAALARLGEMVWLNPSGMERMILIS
jgi:hypothetical protein